MSCIILLKRNCSGKLKRPEPGAASKGPPEMRQIVTMHFEPEALGKFVYRVSARPLPSEANTEDNAAEARMDVTDEKAHVLLIAGSAVSLASRSAKRTSPPPDIGYRSPEYDTHATDASTARPVT